MNNSNAVGITLETKVDKSIQALDKIINKLDNMNGKINKISNNNGFGKVNKSLNETNNLLGKMSTSMGKMSGLSNKLNLGAVIAAFSRLGKQFSKNIDDSASYVENLNLMQVAFQDTRDEAESLVNGLADIFGLDESVMTRQLGYYRQIGNALAIGNDYADLLANNLLKMQLDMSSLYNLSFERSGQVLQASMAGQTKPIRGSTGADITQSSLQTDLDRLGINRQVTDLSRAEKSILIYLSLERQLSASQGDLAKTINSTANQQKIFTEQTQRLSRAFGDVLTPAFTKVLTIANGFLMVIVELVEMFAKFVGFKIPEYDASSYGLDDYFSDVEESADKANKKLSSLRGFDKLNNIKTPTTSGSGSGGIGSVDQRLLDALSEYDLKMDGIQNKATQIRDTIMEWLGFTKEVNEKTGEITWKYDTLGKSAEQIAREIGTNLGEKLTEFTKSLDWEKYGKTIASGLNVALAFVNSFIDSYSFVDLGKSIAKYFNGAINELNWEDLGKTLTNKFKIMIDTLYGFVKTLDWGKLGKGIAEGINGALSNINLAKIIDILSDTLIGLLEGLSNAILTVDWGKLIPATAVFIGFKNLSKAVDLAKTGLSNLVTFISRNVKNSFGFLVESFKDASKKGEGMFTTLKKGIDTWSKNLTNAEKFATGLVGSMGVVSGLSLVKSGMEDIEEEGLTFGNSLEYISGALSTTFGAATIGSLFGPWGTAIGALTGLFATGITTILSTFQETKDPLMEEINSLNDEIKKLNEESSKNLDVMFNKTDRIENLKDELSKLIDSNGNLKGSYDEVNPKIQELNDLLGTEYEVTDDGIYINGKKVSSYKDLEKEIDIYINKLKTKNIIEAYEKQNQERIKLSTDLAKKRNEKYQEIIDLYDKEVRQGGKSAEEFAKQNQTKLKELQDLDKQIQDNEANIDNYYKGVSEAQKGNFDKALKLMSTEADTAKREIRDIATDVEKGMLQTSNFMDDLKKKAGEKYSTTISFTADVSQLEKAVNKYMKVKVTYTPMGENGKYDKSKEVGVGKFSVKGYATGGFPEDGWFRASKGEYFGQFDDGTSYIANNKQITDGIRQATTNGMMDAFAMQMSNGNNQNVNVTIVAEDDGILNAIKFKEKSKDRQYGL